MGAHDTTLAFATGIATALGDRARTDRVVAELQERPQETLARLAGKDGSARDLLLRMPRQAIRFTAEIMAAALKAAGPTLEEMEEDARAALRSSLAISLAAQTAGWLEHDVDEQKLTGTVQDVFDALFGCFLAIADLKDKEQDVADALVRLAACEAEKVLDPTRNCGPERSNFDSAVNSYAVALTNLPDAC